MIYINIKKFEFNNLIKISIIYLNLQELIILYKNVLKSFIKERGENKS